MGFAPVCTILLLLISLRSFTIAQKVGIARASRKKLCSSDLPLSGNNWLDGYPTEAKIVD
jgi:hypothetical protein